MTTKQPIPSSSGLIKARRRIGGLHFARLGGLVGDNSEHQRLVIALTLLDLDERLKAPPRRMRPLLISRDA